jgi:2-oxo-4-hydroxy-4-carboxy-5-ureidoimidazoline decarboxylase
LSRISDGKVQELNTIDRHEFIRVLAPIFEHSPWVAARTVSKRPFAHRGELYSALRETVMKASEDEKICLIRAHPDLAGEVALTRESQSEQGHPVLEELTPGERDQLHIYNERYRQRFGFPFVVCVRLNKKQAILNAFPVRLQNSRGQETETALREIFKIAELRLKDLVS